MELTYWSGGAILGLSGIYEGAVFKMFPNEVLTIGRDSNFANIVIGAECSKVSRKHCSVKYIPSCNGYEITDYSKNGVRVDKKHLLPRDRAVLLSRGSIIEIGNSDNMFKLM